MVKLKRRGRPHKFRATKSILLTFFIAVLLLSAIWIIQSILLDLRFGKLTERLYQLQGETLFHTATINKQLQTKLSANIEKAPKGTARSIVLTYINRYFGKQAPTAERIFTCESGLRPDAFNGQNTNGTSDAGVAQINSIHAKRFQEVTGVPYEVGAFDPNYNIQYAKWLYDHWGNWDAWVCSRIVNA